VHRQCGRRPLALEEVTGSQTAAIGKLLVLSVAADPGGSDYLFQGGRAVFASDDAVFAWAIGKALLIVIVSVGALVYAAWAVTRQSKDAAQIRIPKESALKYQSSVQAGTVLLAGSGTAAEGEGARRIPAKTSAEQIGVPAAEGPAAAA